MSYSKDLLNYLKTKNFNFFSGVPCSILGPILAEIITDAEIKYVPAVRENVALGIASGAFLTGKSSAIFMQNSGIGNIINAITSFNQLYKIPVLMIITWRGFNGQDAPEHIIMGKKMIPLLDMLEIPNRLLGKNFRDDIDWAIKTMDARMMPVALILKERVML